MKIEMDIIDYCIVQALLIHQAKKDIKIWARDKKGPCSEVFRAEAMEKYAIYKRLNTQYIKNLKSKGDKK